MDLQTTTYQMKVVSCSSFIRHFIFKNDTVHFITRIMGNFNNELQGYNCVPRQLVFDNNLSDRARFVYIYMACKPEGWEFFLEPMSKEIGYSKDTLRKYISELVENGWLIKGEQKTENGLFGSVSYTLVAAKFSDTEKVRLGNSPTQDNIEDIDKREKRKEEKSLKKKELTELFETCWIAYNRKGAKKVALERWLNLTDKDRAKAVKHIPFYVRSNERKYLKDFERYISNRTFESVVIDNKTGGVLYDPDRECGTIGYTPTVGGSLMWNDVEKCYYYIGMFYDHIPDGYNDNNRPNGARIVLNNGRGVIVWSSERKRWEKEECTK